MDVNKIGQPSYQTSDDPHHPDRDDLGIDEDYLQGEEVTSNAKSVQSVHFVQSVVSAPQKSLNSQESEAECSFPELSGASDTKSSVIRLEQDLKLTRERLHNKYVSVNAHTRVYVSVSVRVMTLPSAGVQDRLDATVTIPLMINPLVRPMINILGIRVMTNVAILVSLSFSYVSVRARQRARASA